MHIWDKWIHTMNHSLHYFYSGGLTVEVRGTNLNVIQSPKMEFHVNDIKFPTVSFLVFLHFTILVAYYPCMTQMFSSNINWSKLLALTKLSEFLNFIKFLLIILHHKSIFPMQTLSLHTIFSLKRQNISNANVLILSHLGLLWCKRHQYDLCYAEPQTSQSDHAIHCQQENDRFCSGWSQGLPESG